MAILKAATPEPSRLICLSLAPVLEAKQSSHREALLATDATANAMRAKQAHHAQTVEIALDNQGDPMRSR